MIPILRLIFSFLFFFLFFFLSFSEHVKLLRPDGYEVFNKGGCNSSYPASLEVPFGDAEHLILDISLEYRWSVVNVKYSIVGRTLNSGSQPMACQKLLTLLVILGISLVGILTLSN